MTVSDRLMSYGDRAQSCRKKMKAGADRTRRPFRRRAVRLMRQLYNTTIYGLSARHRYNSEEDGRIV